MAALLLGLQDAMPSDHKRKAATAFSAAKQPSKAQAKAKAKAKTVAQAGAGKAKSSDAALLTPMEISLNDGEFSIVGLTATRKISVGSDCSGWGSEMWALLKLGIKPSDILHEFACDISAASKAIIPQNHPPRLWFDDCMSKEHQHAPYVDLYVAGFPCQSYSLAGRNKGLDDARGKVVLGVLSYIERQKPLIFILENVKNITSATHRNVFSRILKRLHSIKSSTGEAYYKIDWAILNSKNHGVPQNRERVYIVGRQVKHIDQSYNFRLSSSAVATSPRLVDFLGIAKERTSLTDLRNSPLTTSSTVSQNLNHAHHALVAAGVDPAKASVVIDIGSGRGLVMMHDLCPTITKTRGSRCDYFMTKVMRKMTIGELCKLQGLDLVKMKVKHDCVSETALGSLAGNAMTISVLAAVISECLLSVNLARQNGKLVVTFQ